MNENNQDSLGDCSLNQLSDENISRQEMKYSTQQLIKLLHDLSQPFTYLLAALEIGAMDYGLSQEECQNLLEVAMQVRQKMQEVQKIVYRPS